METKLRCASVSMRAEQRLRRGLLCGMENNEQTCRIDTYTSRIMRTPIRTREQSFFFVFHIAAWGPPRISVDFNLYFTCQNTKLTKVLISVRGPSLSCLSACLFTHKFAARRLFPFTTMIGNYQETIQTGISFRDMLSDSLETRLEAAKLSPRIRVRDLRGRNHMFPAVESCLLQNAD